MAENGQKMAQTSQLHKCATSWQTKRLYSIFGWKLYFGLLANNRPNLIRHPHWTLSAGQRGNSIWSVGWSWFYVDLQQLYFFVSISSGSTCLNSTRSSSGSYESLSASSPFCETVFAIHTNKSSTPDPSLKNLSTPNHQAPRSDSWPQNRTIERP